MSSVLQFPSKPTVLEFFAGVGLARMGLEEAGFRVNWANDIAADKQNMYVGHFADEDGHYRLSDISAIGAADVPTGSALAWASSPCTDLSLAGNRSGLAGSESSAFYEFIRILEEMGSDRPRVAVLENVVGLATSHGGDDLAAAIKAFNSLGYSVDVLTLDAKRFVPQSRPRLFLVAAQNPPELSATDDTELRPAWLQPFYADPTLRMHRAHLPQPPSFMNSGFGELAEKLDTNDSRWWSAERKAAFIESMSPTQSERFRALKRAKTTSYRTAYRRTRNGVPVWEMRSDDISGCLRTARGGSSKQAVVKLGHGKAQVRWMTGIEYARLMGAGNYKLSGLRDSQIHFAFGDAVAMPAVQWLGQEYLMPLVNGKLAAEMAVEVQAVV